MSWRFRAILALDLLALGPQYFSGWRRIFGCHALAEFRRGINGDQCVQSHRSAFGLLVRLTLKVEENEILHHHHTSVSPRSPPAPGGEEFKSDGRNPRAYVRMWSQISWNYAQQFYR